MQFYTKFGGSLTAIDHGITIQMFKKAITDPENNYNNTRRKCVSGEMLTSVCFSGKSKCKFTSNWVAAGLN